MFKSTLMAATLATLLAGPALADDDRRHRDRDRDDRWDRRDDDRRYDRRDDRRRDWNDFKRGDWSRDRHRDRGHHYGWRNKHRDWRHVPPARFRGSHYYRSAYELAWRDWMRHGRYDRRWRRHHHSTLFRVDIGYRSGYEDGWRDAAYYYGRGYRPRYWAHDPLGGWYFGFHIEG